MRRYSPRYKRIIKKDTFYQTPYGLLSFQLSRSSARRSLAITIDENARVQVAAPYLCSEKEIFSFIKQKSQWIFEKIAEAKQHLQTINNKRFCDGHTFLYLGKSLPLAVKTKDIKRSRIEFDGFQWKVDVPQELALHKQEQAVKAKLIQWYRQQAQEILGGRIFHHARRMNLTPNKVAVRSFKRLWGNCDYNTKTIQLNWQVILSPLNVIDYVVVHELCHLVHPNHSQRFWKKVEKYMPDYREHKRWLKEHATHMVLP